MLLNREFSDAELSALRLDGDAFAVHGSTLSLDSPDVLSTRVSLARGDAPKRMVVDRLSAAWVWGATEVRPQPAMICADLRERTSKQLGEWAPHKTYRFVDGDVWATDGGPVLSPWRTLLHVLRFDSAEHPEVLSALVELNQLAITELADAIIKRVHPTARRRYLEPLRALSL